MQIAAIRIWTQIADIIPKDAIHLNKIQANEFRMGCNTTETGRDITNWIMGSILTVCHTLETMRKI